MPSKTLPQVLKEFSISDVRLRKLDVEGAEFAILRTLGPGEPAKLQSIAMEYHPGAYQVRELFAMSEDWTHHVSLMDERSYSGNILRYARKGILGP